MLHRRVCVAAITALLLLPACVRAYDATIANPCDSELSIESYRASSDGLAEEERIAQFQLPAEEVTKVEYVFDDAGGTRWALLVVDTDFEINVSKEQVQKEMIPIPASACP